MEDELGTTQPPWKRRRGAGDRKQNGRSLPERIGPYPILDELGRGGMGVVYLAADTRLKRPIALKVLPAENARNELGLELFEREAQLLAAITHPNIATIHTLEEADDLHFLTMELVAGDTLEERLSAGPLPIADTMSIGRQIAAALEATHKKEIVHRDLKPVNIKITAEGQVKVLDFGIARVREAGSESAIAVEDSMSPFCGTPGYMSPEQLRGEEIDHRSDVWSFGCILYECLTGRAAFPGDTPSDRAAATLGGDPELGALPPEVPERVRDLVSRCLARELAKRLQSITDARQELEEELALRAVSRAGLELPREEEQAAPNNLPLRLDSFVGREEAIQDVKRLLAENRLLTLTGIGGGGKTRLALEAARELLPGLPDGVWLVDLSPLSDPSRVPQEVATTLGLKERPGHTLTEIVADYLEDKELLLLLDNCEHLLGACADLARSLITADPRLRILATSREGLGITGETIYQVPSLRVPAPDAAGTLRELGETEAVRLFVERAQEVDTGFELASDNAPAVARICRRLDGIPLALELAAARVRALPADEIARRLDQSFNLLAGGARTSLPRHQTLRALFDWSYHQLSPAERALLRRLSVFAGGWTLDAAEEVGAGDGIEELEVLDLHSHLVNKSLVEMDAGARRATGKARYRMLETLREYAWDRLLEAGEVTRVRRRHLEYFMTLAEEAEPYLKGFEQTRWFVRLGSEHDNLRLAFDSCAALEGGDPEIGLRLAGALGRYWMVQGHWSEGRSLIAAELARGLPGRRTAARAKTLNGAGNLAFHQGDYDQARSCHEEALAIRRELGDRTGEAMSLNNLGEVARLTGDHARARELYEASLAIQEEIGDRWGMAVSLNNLGEVWQGQGDYARARRFHEQALAMWPETGDRWGRAWSLSNLGFVAERQGSLPEARSFYERSLAISRELGDRFGVALSLHALGIVAAGQRDQADASAFHRESLAIRQELRDRTGIAESLESLARLAVVGEEPARAARLLAAAAAQRELIHAPLSATVEEEHARLVASLRAALGEATFAGEWAAGRAMSLERAIEYAGEEGDG